MNEDKEKSSLKVRGLTPEQKEFLYQYAQNELGCRSRTKAILHLIDEKMGKEPTPKEYDYQPIDEPKKRKRVQISLLPQDYDNLQKAAQMSDSSMQHYLIKLLVSNLYNEKILNGTEYELLRKSNYQLHKIGVNLNQIAKAINEGEHRKVPIETLAQYIEQHVNIIKKILNRTYSQH